MNRRFIFGPAFAVLLAMSLPAATLAATTINNGGFESSTTVGAFMPVPAGSTAIAGWDVTLGGVDWIGTYWPAPEGTKSVDMNRETPGAISQILTTTVNDTYVVEFLLAGNPTNAATCPTVLKTLNVTANGGQLSSYTFDTTATSYGDMGWLLTGYSFVATGASTTLTFTSTTPGACGPALDNVTVTETAATGARCKKDGWVAMFDSAGNMFKNQGDCVSYYATDGGNLGAIAP